MRFFVRNVAIIIVPYQMIFPLAKLWSKTSYKWLYLSLQTVSQWQKLCQNQHFKYTFSDWICIYNMTCSFAKVTQNQSIFSLIIIWAQNMFKSVHNIEQFLRKYWIESMLLIPCRIIRSFQLNTLCIFYKKTNYIPPLMFLLKP